MDAGLKKKAGGGFGLVSTLVLFTWLAYLVLGNLSRIGQASSAGGMPLLEVLLFMLVAIAYLLRPVPVTSLTVVFSLLVLVSWAIGAMLSNQLPLQEHLIASAYALRLVFTVLTSNFLGWLLSRYASPEVMSSWVLRVLLAQVGIGMLLYILFPSSPDLWQFLSQYGINFAGDPHQRRLLGPPLDPNFFGNILVFGLVIAFALMGSDKKSVRLGAIVYAIIFFTTTVLTVSRSSLLGALGGAGLYLLILLMVSYRRSGVLVRVLALLLLLCFLAAMVSLFVIGDELSRLAERIITTAGDDSALQRLTSALGGLSYLTNSAVLLGGMGYNYIPSLASPEVTVTSFYSSIINAVVAFGLPLFAILIVVIFVACMAPLKHLYRYDVTLFAGTLAYLVMSVLMSLFNNLLFYSLFLLLVLPWMFFFYWRSVEVHR